MYKNILPFLEITYHVKKEYICMYVFAVALYPQSTVFKVGGAAFTVGGAAFTVEGAAHNFYRFYGPKI